jgi:hypothetical protein
VVNIAKKKLDIRPYLGMIVVFLIVAGIVLAGAWFLVLKPGGEALTASKQSALTKVTSLNSIGTSKAVTDASSFTTQIQTAGSTSAVNTVLSEVNSAIEREQKRKDLLDVANNAASGTFYSADSEEGKTQLASLSELRTTLTAGINAQNTLAELQAYETTLNNLATTAWRSVQTSVLSGLAENRVCFTIDDPPQGGFMDKDAATLYISTNDWLTLRRVKFTDATVRVPVKDTLERTASITNGSNVNVYLYDMTLDNMALLFREAPVKYVLYSESDMGSIAWSYTAGTTTYSTTVNVWETLKAAAFGNADAATLSLTAFGDKVENAALQANVSSYSSEVIYVIEVDDLAAEQITVAEFEKSTTQDIILVQAV